MALAVALFAPAAASAAITSVLAGDTISGAPVPCATQPDGTRVCFGTYDNGTGDTDLRLKSFDGTPAVDLRHAPAGAGLGLRRPLPADRPEPRLG